MENSVFTPLLLLLLLRSTSKYGSSRVAAGTSSMVQISAIAWPPRAIRPTKARQSVIFFMKDTSSKAV